MDRHEEIQEQGEWQCSAAVLQRGAVPGDAVEEHHSAASRKEINRVQQMEPTLWHTPAGPGTPGGREVTWSKGLGTNLGNTVRALLNHFPR